MEKGEYCYLVSSYVYLLLIRKNSGYVVSSVHENTILGKVRTLYLLWMRSSLASAVIPVTGTVAIEGEPNYEYIIKAICQYGYSL